MAKLLDKTTIEEEQLLTVKAKETRSERRARRAKEAQQKHTEVTDTDRNACEAGSVSVEKAKTELEQRIAEKLSRMSNTDTEELFNLHQQQLMTKKKEARDSVSRRNAVAVVQPVEADLVCEVDSVIQPVEAEPAQESEIIEEITQPEEEILAIEPEADVVEVAPINTLSDSELESKVDAFYDGFTEADAEEVSGIQEFKENFLFHFDRFASGELLESASNKANAAFGRIAAKASNLKTNTLKIGTHIAFGFSKMFGGVKKLKGKVIRRAAVNKADVNETTCGHQKRSRFTKFMLIKYKKNVVRNEQKASSCMAKFINKLDRGNEVLTEKTVEAAITGNKHFNAARDWSDLNKKKLLLGLAAVITCAITTVSILNYFTAYIYAYNGRQLGMVKHQEDVLRVLAIVSEQLSREYGATINIDSENDITFERVISTSVNREVDNMQEVFNRLTYMQDMSARAYALFIDGRRIAILDTEDSVQEMLDEFSGFQLAQTSNGQSHYESISFAEDISIRQVDTQLGRLDDSDEILQRIVEGTMSQRVHVVQRGETLSAIARLHGMSQAELEGANPGIVPARLQIDQEIVLQHAVPLLTVQTVEVVTFAETIAYETIFEDDPNAFRGEQTTRVTGVVGEREVTARITRNNGLQIAREDLNEVVLAPASAAVVMRGTREPPPRQGTGRLINPVPSGYRLTSRFGMRNGRMHNGIDMAARSGTRIVAADGGTVVFAGWRGSFGNLVIIDHGGGIRTYYAHASRLFVSRGDRVFQGQHIANVGSTGRSTGPHLHFEVHVNGRPQNPLNFL